jgi:hypothetical protein
MTRAQLDRQMILLLTAELALSGLPSIPPPKDRDYYNRAADLWQRMQAIISDAGFEISAVF